ncbi:MAG: UDP-N-acetylmuramoyl-tripeptide--D-alanyl-D-alanine ligase [Gemmatimonadota bacterium]|nr:UDP-N-acetylmuramoyl-tripeptide--D-alanyl-D-alanine ligase [Gemmatimonadota bacterium]
MTGRRWTDLEVRTALGLRTDLGGHEPTYTEVSTDSRAIGPGALYVALSGDRFDGHDFIADAVAGGARGVIASRMVPAARDITVYPVNDTLVALGALARHRRALLECPVVAITGSTGKTTTKDFLSAALGTSVRTHATHGNRNNRVGVPLTLLECPDEAEVVVLELGTNEPGEIRTLTEIARPDIAVITNVGESHLDGLGSLEGVMEEKLDLLRGLGPGGRAVVGDEPPELPAAARRIVPEVTVAGMSELADANARPGEIATDAFGRYRFHWRGRPVSVPLAGRHGVSNALLALTVAEFLDVPTDRAVRGLESAETGDLRGQVRPVGDLTVIVDCYNANPQSMRAALGILESYQASSGKVAVLGTMLELGNASERLHAEVLAAAIAREIELIVATGQFAEAARSLQESYGDRVLAAAEWRDAYPELRDRLEGDEVILLKGSRGVALEEMLPMLESDFAGDGDAGGTG